MGIEDGVPAPEDHWKVKFPMAAAGFPWWILLVLLVVIGIILFFCCQSKPEETYKPLVPVEEPKPVLVMVWDTPKGSVTTEHFTKPGSLRFTSGTAPLKISRDTGNLGDLGVEVGWGLKIVNDIDLRSYSQVSQLTDILRKQEVGSMEVALTFTQGGGAEKSVYCDLSKRPLGMRFSAKFPLTIDREQAITRSLGIQVGWALKSINGSDITGITDYKQINDKLKATEIGLIEVPMTWDTPRGDVTVHAIMKPLGLKFPSEVPLKISEEKEGHGKEIGVEVGWSLKNINGVDVSKMTDFTEVNSVLHAHVKRL